MPTSARATRGGPCFFLPGALDACADRATLGVKGAALHQMAAAGLPVPPGFVLPCRAKWKPAELAAAVQSGLARLERATGRRLGEAPGALRVAVRTSSAMDMPGLMPAALDLTNPHQVLARVKQALRSWDSDIATAHRRKHAIDPSRAVAVIVQSMAGDAGRIRAHATTRDPQTGANKLRGEWFDADERPHPLPLLRLASLEIWKQLHRLTTRLEHCFGDVMALDFVIVAGLVMVLNARPADRSARARVRIAVEMARAGIITRSDAVLRVTPESIEALLHPRFTGAPGEPHAAGNPASPGAACGQLALSANAVQRFSRDGRPVILARTETDATDVTTMRLCRGILTSSGGMTSHAAIIARGLGIPCITGAAPMRIDAVRKRLRIGGSTLHEGDWISIDGSTGRVFAAHLRTTVPRVDQYTTTLLRWADRLRTLDVQANADTPADARLARSLGAQGIGLCRTEHMFFHPARIDDFRAMILAADADARRPFIRRLLPQQRRDFVGLFMQMRGLPVTIRLLDPPLHEFLPHDEADMRSLARRLHLSLAPMRHRIDQFRETNPMLGHRGNRLAITHPDILRMQVRAIVEAGCICALRRIRTDIGIMVPLVSAPGELEFLIPLIRTTADEVMRERGRRIACRVGAMIETPRAALTAGAIARVAEFFSFGTNDLTQMTWGLSRDDSAGLVHAYLDQRILSRDPFGVLDSAGVGRLMRMAIEDGRRARVGLECGVCGEHGGDPESIALCQSLGIDYISCSPHRLVIARLAAAHAVLRAPGV